MILKVFALLVQVALRHMRIKLPLAQRSKTQRASQQPVAPNIVAALAKRQLNTAQAAAKLKPPKLMTAPGNKCRRCRTANAKIRRLENQECRNPYRGDFATPRAGKLTPWNLPRYSTAPKHPKPDTAAPTTCCYLWATCKRPLSNIAITPPASTDDAGTANCRESTSPTCTGTTPSSRPAHAACWKAPPAASTKPSTSSSTPPT